MRIIKKSKIKLSPKILKNMGLDYPQQIFLSYFYTGLFPVASGTFGSLVASLLYFCNIKFWWLIILITVVYLIGIKLSTNAEKILGDDPSFITIDEAVGMWIALASPIFQPDILYLILAFITFRFFDIVKIFPSNYYDKQKGGIGIMTDDVFAGIYANIVSHLAYIGITWFPLVNDFINSNNFKF